MYLAKTQKPNSCHHNLGCSKLKLLLAFGIHIGNIEQYHAYPECCLTSPTAIPAIER